MLTHADLFCGMGGFSYGLGEAFPIKCVYACDNNEAARRIYEHLHGVRPVGSLEDTWKDIPDGVDILTAGFPCQPYSHAGWKKGLEDYKRALSPMIAMVRAITIKQPKIIILENVPTFLNFKKFEQAREYLFSSLTMAGYLFEPFVASPHTHANLAQNRPRMFIVGTKDTVISPPPQVPLTDCIRNHLIDDYDWLRMRFLRPKSVNESKLIRHILDCNEEPMEFVYRRMYDDLRKVSVDGVIPTLTCHACMTNTKDMLAVKERNDLFRILSVEELLSLQGFDYSWVNHDVYEKVLCVKDHSSNPLRIRVGNSVSPPVVTAVANQIKDYMNDK